MIPTAALPHRIEIEPHVGTTGNGEPRFGPVLDRPRRARIVVKRTQVRGADGTITLADAVAQVRPGADVIPSQSRLYDSHGRVWEIRDVAPAEELGRVWAVNLILDGPRPAVVPVRERAR